MGDEKKDIGTGYDDLEKMSKGIWAATKALKDLGLSGAEATAALMVTLGLAAEANGVSEVEFLESMLDARGVARVLIKTLRDKGLLSSNMGILGNN